MICGLGAPAASWGEEEKLRWKFEVGQKLDYVMVQEMKMMGSGGAVGQINTTLRQEMDMIWDVQGVDKKTGEAVIKQKFDRMKIKMTTPYGTFEYDSKSDAPPTGLAAMIAPMYKAMTKDEFEITMTSRGEIRDVRIPDGVLDAIKSSPGAAQLGDIASEAGFRKMMSQGSLVLPEAAPKKGDTWSTKIEMNNPVAGGKQSVETTYTFEGTREVEGVTYAVIKPSLKMEIETKKAEKPEEKKPAESDDKKPAETTKKESPPQTPAIEMNIAEQESTGEVLFNIRNGRLSSTTLNQKVTIEATIGGQKKSQKIEQLIDVKVTPSGERNLVEEPTQPANGEEKSPPQP
ncbi:MAG: hypothetical protein IT425_12225 [Pirellulales bacterium]|nr:hypothetical protein [Pirellulales bacterium]